MPYPLGSVMPIEYPLALLSSILHVQHMNLHPQTGPLYRSVLPLVRHRGQWPGNTGHNIFVTQFLTPIMWRAVYRSGSPSFSETSWSPRGPHGPVWISSSFLRGPNGFGLPLLLLLFILPLPHSPLFHLPPPPHPYIPDDFLSTFIFYHPGQFPHSTLLYYTV